jgi:hypothetical protein
MTDSRGDAEGTPRKANANTPPVAAKGTLRKHQSHGGRLECEKE